MCAQLLTRLWRTKDNSSPPPISSSSTTGLGLVPDFWYRFYVKYGILVEPSRYYKLVQDFLGHYTRLNDNVELDPSTFSVGIGICPREGVRVLSYKSYFVVVGDSRLELKRPPRLNSFWRITGQSGVVNAFVQVKLIAFLVLWRNGASAAMRVLRKIPCVSEPNTSGDPNLQVLHLVQCVGH